MRYIAVLFVLVLAGCQPPVISDISDSAVKIQHSPEFKQAEVDAKAIEACAIYGKKPTGPLSEKCATNNCYIVESLYACQ